MYLTLGVRLISSVSFAVICAELVPFNLVIARDLAQKSTTPGFPAAPSTWDQVSPKLG